MERNKEIENLAGSAAKETVTLISELPWDDLDETVYRKSKGRASSSLERAGFTTLEELLDYFEDSYDENRHGTGISGFGQSCFQATKYLLESMGFEVPVFRFN